MLNILFKKNFLFYCIMCNDFYNKFLINLSYPYTKTLSGIIYLHDYVCYFLMIMLIFTFVFLTQSFISAYYNKRIAMIKNREVQNYKLRLAKKNILFYINTRAYNWFTHNSFLEFFWTIIPALILVIIAYPSFTLLYAIDLCIDPVYTISIIGNQWYWTYEYSDFQLTEILYDYFINDPWIQKVFLIIHQASFYSLPEYAVDFEPFSLEDYAGVMIKKFRPLLDGKVIMHSNMVPDNMLPEGYLRLLTTDKPLILPASTPVRLLITSKDVIHSWAVPSFGIKMDAVPGRINQVYFYSDVWSINWGQCSELCGINHGFMPIEVHVVPLRVFLDIMEIQVLEVISKPYALYSKILYKYAIKKIEALKVLSEFAASYDYIKHFFDYINVVDTSHKNLVIDPWLAIGGWTHQNFDFDLYLFHCQYFKENCIDLYSNPKLKEDYKNFISSEYDYEF